MSFIENRLNFLSEESSLQSKPLNLTALNSIESNSLLTFDTETSNDYLYFIEALLLKSCYHQFLAVDSEIIYWKGIRRSRFIRISFPILMAILTRLD